MSNLRPCRVRPAIAAAKHALVSQGRGEERGLRGAEAPQKRQNELQSRWQLLMRADVVVVVVFTTQQQTGGDGDTVASVKGRTNEILIMMMVVLGRTNWAADRW